MEDEGKDPHIDGSIERNGQMMSDANKAIFPQAMKSSLRSSYEIQEGQEGSYEGGQEDGDYEDPEEVIKEFGRHPMMDRVQSALYNQLLQTHERVSDELREKEADAKK